MTIRQRFLKFFYPFFLMLNKLAGNRQPIKNKKHVSPPVSFYSLSFQRNNGEQVSMENYRGKKVLLVNTASNCGYTAQYSELQALYENAKDKLVIIGFPANDFKNQEAGSDEEIQQFCSINYNLTFPLAKKTTVIKTQDQNPVYQWLTDATKNGWNTKQPSWNFAKYLVNEEGFLTDYFEPQDVPSSSILNTNND